MYQIVENAITDLKIVSRKDAVAIAGGILTVLIIRKKSR